MDYHLIPVEDILISSSLSTVLIGESGHFGCPRKILFDIYSFGLLEKKYYFHPQGKNMLELSAIQNMLLCPVRSYVQSSLLCSYIAPH